MVYFINRTRTLDPGPGPLEKSDPGPLEKADPPLFRPQLGTWNNSMVLNSNPLPILWNSTPKCILGKFRLKIKIKTVCILNGPSQTSTKLRDYIPYYNNCLGIWRRKLHILIYYVIWVDWIQIHITQHNGQLDSCFSYKINSFRDC